MGKYQKWVAIGVIGHVDMKYTADAKPKLHFSVGVDRSFGKDSKTDWPQCICFGKTAELHVDLMKVGRKVLVEGRIETFKNDKGFFTNVNVSYIEYQDKNPDNAKSDAIKDVKEKNA